MKTIEKRTRETMVQNFISCPNDVYTIKSVSNLISSSLTFYVSNKGRNENFAITADNKLSVWELLRDLDNMGGRSVMYQIDKQTPIAYKDSIPFQHRFN